MALASFFNSPAKETDPFQQKLKNETEMRIRLASILSRNPGCIMFFRLECSPVIFIIYVPTQQEKDPALKICHTEVHPIFPVIAASARLGRVHVGLPTQSIDKLSFLEQWPEQTTQIALRRDRKRLRTQKTDIYLAKIDLGMTENHAMLRKRVRTRSFTRKESYSVLSRSLSLYSKTTLFPDP